MPFHCYFEHECWFSTYSNSYTIYTFSFTIFTYKFGYKYRYHELFLLFSQKPVINHCIYERKPIMHELYFNPNSVHTVSIQACWSQALAAISRLADGSVNKTKRSTRLIVNFILLFKAWFQSLLSTCQLRFQIRKLSGNFATKFASSFQSSNFDCKQM